MAKKITPLTQDEELRLADAVRASAQQIWKAGLGAFVKAQQEGGRAFTRLVKDGTELQKRARTLEDAADTVARAAGRATRRAGSWGKLEQVFEERVARALAAIGVPARTELEALERRIGELEQVVAGLIDQQAPARKPAAKRTAKAPPARPVAARAVASKTVAAKAVASKAVPAKAVPAKSVAARRAATPASPAAPAGRTAAKKTAARKPGASG